MKYLILESQYNRAIGKFLSYQFDPHEEKTWNKFPNLIFWVKNGVVVAKIEKSRNFFWVKFAIWKNISEMTSSDNNEVQSIINDWLERNHGLGELTPISEFSNYDMRLEDSEDE